MEKYLFVAFAAVGLAGCAGTNASVSEPPPDIRPAIVAHKSSLWKDPDSVRDAAIGPVTRGIFGWKACLRANAKNSFGGFTGLKSVIVQTYDNGSPPVILDATIYDACGSVPYTPFPEVNGKG
mgnify:CR=1 FL=1